jgi:hypothetical protein
MTAPVDEVGDGIVGAGKLDGLGDDRRGEDATRRHDGIHLLRTQVSSTNIIDEQRQSY